jgi:formylmethanofuran dehydrogenase subunit A
MYDLKITGGTVVDGTGADRFRADIGVKDGRIVEVRRRIGDDADLEGEAAETLDATGRIVAPGSSTSTPTTTAKSAGIHCWSRRARTESPPWSAETAAWDSRPSLQAANSGSSS